MGRGSSAQVLQILIAILMADFLHVDGVPSTVVLELDQAETHIGQMVARLQLIFWPNLSILE